jgi:UDP-N-acetylmuramoylalanine--D-glutamate ligase
VLIGESGPELEQLFRAAGLGTTERADSLDAAVARADALARETLQARVLRVNQPAGAARTGGAPSRPTATVLLSPAAASFDMFEDYEARGRAFKAAVARLIEDRS